MGADASGVGATPPIIDADVAAVTPAKVFERLAERRQIGLYFRIIFDERAEHADPTETNRLRSRRQRPRRRAAEQRDDLAPFPLMEMHPIPPGPGNASQDS